MDCSYRLAWQHGILFACLWIEEVNIYVGTSEHDSSEAFSWERRGHVGRQHQYTHWFITCAVLYCNLGLGCKQPPAPGGRRWRASLIPADNWRLASWRCLFQSGITGLGLGKQQETVTIPPYLLSFTTYDLLLILDQYFTQCFAPRFPPPKTNTEQTSVNLLMAVFAIKTYIHSKSIVFAKLNE